MPVEVASLDSLRVAELPETPEEAEAEAESEM